MAVFFLCVWFFGDQRAALFGARWMKTNTALSLALLAASILLGGRSSTWSRRIARVCAVGALAIGAFTLAEYVLHIELGIDQLLAREPYNSESAPYFNRMAPNTAVGLIVGSIGALLSPSHRGHLARFGQLMALLTFSIGLISLIGYLYEVVLLYRPTPYIRLSQYTAIALVLLSTSLLLANTDHGVARVLVGSSVASYLARRLLIAAICVPIVYGWLLLGASRLGLVGEGAQTTVLVVAFIITFAVMVLLMVRPIETMDRRRAIADADLRATAEMVAALARAASVDEVVQASIDVGLPALGTRAGGIFLMTPDRRALRIHRSSGFRDDLLKPYVELPLERSLPITDAVRTGEPIFLRSIDEWLARYPEVLREHIGPSASWASLPLRGRDRLLGGLVLSFDTYQAFDDAQRDKLMGLAWQCGQALDRALLFESERDAQHQAAIAADAAETANRAKDEFLAMLGHELRNPLSPILTSVEIMKLRGGDTFQRERAVIERQVHHLTRLVDDLLDVSRITRGKVELKRSTLELNEIVVKAIEVASPLLEQRRHQLVLDVPARGLWVNADEHRMAQVVSNLLTNAAKYTDSGGRIEVSAAVDGDDVTLSVKDDGIGIPAALLPRMFGLFTQGERTIERSQGGLGLGLAIVKSLVEMHGGTVGAASEGAGQGSTFSIRLPLADAALTQRAIGSDPPQRQQQQRSGMRRRVLIVDDNVDAAEMLAEIFRQEGHQVEVAYDGPSALARAGSFDPELVLLDIGLPVMDGFEVARRLRKMTFSSPLKLIAVTGYGQESDRAQTKAAGFDHHLVKPVDPMATLAFAS